MVRAFHYTSKKKWDKIQEDGCLRAKSKLITPRNQRDSGVEIPDSGFVFAFLGTPRPKSWEDSGYLGHLLNDYFAGEETVLLSFDVPKKYASVLDAKPTLDFFEGKRDIEGAFGAYIDSKVPLKKYKGNYNMPELVIGRDIPVSGITLEGRV